MGTVLVDESSVTVRLSPAERVFAFHPDLEVGRDHVAAATRTDRPWRLLLGVQMPGSSLPFVAAIGTWRHRARPGRTGRDFVVVRGTGPAVVVELTDHRFDRLILTVDDPDELLAALAA